MKSIVDTEREILNNINKKNSVVEISEQLQRINSVDYIHDYDYTPKFLMGKIEGEKDNLFMGFELEVDDGGKKSKIAKGIIDLLGDDVCYVVEDGSLNDGLEIVTHPQTLSKHKINKYEELFKFLKMKNYKASHTCGLHVHINRDFFGDKKEIDYAITKMLLLIEKIWNYNTLIARRESNQYSKRLIYNKEETSIFRIFHSALYEGKYNFVNLQHSNTIELRMFSSTLNYKILMATLEYVRNLAYLCKKIDIKDISKIEFKDVMKIMPLEFLDEFCKTRKIQY